MKKYIAFLISLFISEINANPIEEEILKHFEKNYIYANAGVKKKVNIISKKLISYNFDSIKLNKLLKLTKEIRGCDNVEKATPFLEAIDRTFLLFKNDISLFNSDKFIIISLFFSTINPKYFESLEHLLEIINFLNINLIFDDNCKNKTKKIEKHLNNQLIITFILKNKEFLKILLNREINFVNFLNLLDSLSTKTDQEISNIQNYVNAIIENGTPSYNENNRKQASEDFFDAIFCNDETYIKALPYLKEIFNLFPETTIDFRYFIGSYLLKNVNNNICDILDVLFTIINKNWDPTSFVAFLNTIIMYESYQNILDIIHQTSCICSNFKNFSKNVVQYYVKYFSENQHHFLDFFNELNNDENINAISGELFLKKIVTFELSKKQKNDSVEENNHSKNIIISATNTQLEEKKEKYSQLLNPKKSPTYEELRQKRLERFNKKNNKTL
ncbi:MAG: hypothetical protein Q8S31_03870 [Alphaproteobacteria bacterium]|nr:hypothetical protein [Alphaproteobacteria bacterium]